MGWLIAVAGLAGCGGEVTRLPEAAPPAAGVFFAEEVAPILEQRCSGLYCHSAAEGGAPHGEGHGFFSFPTDAAGRLSSPAQVEAARVAALEVSDTTEDVGFSTLLRKPLAPASGGLPHEGGHAWRSVEDPGYQAVARWLALEGEGGGEGLAASELSPLEVRFRDEVQPVLVELRCMTASCHGPDAFLTALRLQPPVRGAFSSGQVRANARKLRSFAYLNGPVGLSRVLVKAIPMERGGVLHKGGNEGFMTGPEDPRFEVIAGWLRELQTSLVGAEPALDGIAFISGPPTPAPLFDVTAPRAGTDLYILRAGASAAENVTGGLHGPGADVRDPAVSHDGTKLAFAMRPSASEGMNLYVMDLASRQVQQLTSDPAVAASGVPIANVQPVFGPDGHLYFTSTRSGELGDRGELPNTDVWELDPESGLLRRRTWGPNQEVEPTFLRSCGFAGELAFTSTRQFGEVFNAPVFRFPPNLKSEYHVHFGTQLDAVLLGLVDGASGLQAVVVTDRGSVWDAGALALIDRNFGPDIVEERRVAEASVPRFAHTMQNVTPEVAWRGVSMGGLYRDPSVMPDGRLLVSRAPGPVDTCAEGDSPDFGLYALTIGFDAATQGPVVLRSELIYDQPGTAEVAAVPLARRALEPYAPHHDDWSSPTGFINVFDLGLLQAIVETLEPRQKAMRTDLAFVRVLEALPPRPDEMEPVDPAQTLHGDPAATWLSGGSHDRVRVLGTLPLGPDTSFYAEIPSNRPIRFQALNADKMAVGAQHQRWIFANPGEVLFHATHQKVYRVRCAGCHGALDGVAATAVGEVPDIVSTASVSYSTHQGANPLSPVAPVALGLDPSQTRVIDFQRDLQPIFDRSCATAACHGSATPPGGLSLSGRPTRAYNEAYEHLLLPGAGSGGGRRYVDEPDASAIQSFLMEKLLGRELEAPRALDAPCPPPGSGVPPLSEADKELITTWIDTGAVFRGLTE